ncbi:MAG: two-component regulator propeller domain-containing protein [Bacteroidota bacterium]
MSPRVQAFRVFWLCFLAISSAMAQPQPADQTSALPVWLQTPSYKVRNLSTDDGLPNNTFLSGLQASDGYLWFGGYGGLVRFDGVHFDVFNESTEPLMDNDGVYALHEDAQGRLWIGTQGGGCLVYYKGNFHNPIADSTWDRVNFYAIAEDAQGGMWLATEYGILYYDDGNIATISALEYFSGINLSETRMTLDTEGNLWIGTNGSGLYRYDGTELHRFEDEIVRDHRIYAVLSAQEGTVWASTQTEIHQFTTSGELIQTIANEEGQPTIMRGLRIDEAGDLWLGGLDGVSRRHRGEWKRVVNQKGKYLHQVSSMFFDHQGSLWATTYNTGLWQIAPSKFINYPFLSSVPSGDVMTMIPTEDSVLFGAEKGLWRLGADGVQHYEDTQEYMIKLLFEDAQENLLLGTYDGLFQYQQGKVKEIGPELGLGDGRIRDMLIRDGETWVGTRSGLYVWDGDSVFIPEYLEPLSKIFVLSMMEDTEGNIWISANSDGLFRWDGEQIQHFTYEDGLGSEVIFRMVQDQSGAIWMGTTAGLTRYQDGVFNNLGLENGFPEKIVFQPTLDAQNRLWLIGQFHVWGAELEKFHRAAEDNSLILSGLTILNRTDGLLSGETSGVAQVAWDDHEHLYIGTPLGVSILDVNQQFEQPTPQVLLDKVVGEQETFHSSTVELAPGNRRMDIYYTAIDYLGAQALRFRYRLDGFDDNWQEVGDERVAKYTNLPPGDYTFQLQVLKKDLNWTEPITLLSVNQQPFFYQTLVFRILVGLVVLVILYSAYITRIRILRAVNQRLEATVAERTEVITQQKESIIRQSADLQSGIRYAQRIQEALLPTRMAIREHLPETFVLYKPKERVSGDFYWLEVVGDTIYLAVASPISQQGPVPGPAPQSA